MQLGHKQNSCRPSKINIHCSLKMSGAIKCALHYSISLMSDIKEVILQVIMRRMQNKIMCKTAKNGVDLQKIQEKVMPS